MTWNSLSGYNRSCSAPHLESRKIKFAIFWLFYDFIDNLQDPAIWLYYWRYTFAQGPLERSKMLQPCPCFALKTLERKGAGPPEFQRSPWPWMVAGPPEFLRSPTGLGRAIAGGGARAHPGLSGAGVGGREAGGDGVRRLQVASVAAA
jgi:hypothetical protein